jgi:hypothetical protein
MSCQQLTHNVSDSVLVVLSLDDVAVTGLTFADVTAQFRKDTGSFAAKALTALNFIEQGNGVYEIIFTAAELNTVGTFTVVVTGVDIDQSTTIAQVVPADEVSSSVSLQTCVVTGHVTLPTGAPFVGAAVSARIIGMPSIEQSQAVVTDDLVTAQTNENGEFFLTLIRLADVEVFIPVANYRKRLVVPNAASAELFDIP